MKISWSKSSLWLHQHKCRGRSLDRIIIMLCDELCIPRYLLQFTFICSIVYQRFKVWNDCNGIWKQNMGVRCWRMCLFQSFLSFLNCLSSSIVKGWESSIIILTKTSSTSFISADDKTKIQYSFGDVCNYSYLKYKLKLYNTSIPCDF